MIRKERNGKRAPEKRDMVRAISVDQSPTAQ